MGGVTCAFTGPGSANVIGGQSIAMKTYGKVIDNMAVKEPAGLKIAFGENPKEYMVSKIKCQQLEWQQLHCSVRH